MAWISLSVNQLKENVRVIQRDRQREDRNVKRITAMIERIWNESKKKKKRNENCDHHKSKICRNEIHHISLSILLLLTIPCFIWSEKEKSEHSILHRQILWAFDFFRIFSTPSRITFQKRKKTKKTTSSLYIV